MKKNIDIKKDNNSIQNRDFSEVYGIIAAHRDRVVQVVNNESLLMIWEVGGYVSKKISTTEWGDGVVRQLSEYIRTKDPTIRGWSYRTIYKMVQFYETYSSPAFKELLHNTNTLSMPSKSKGEIVPIGLAQLTDSSIVPIELAQLPSSEFVPFEIAQIPSVLFYTGWSNHQLIMNQCKSYDQQLFYILYAGYNKLEYKELERAIKTNAMSAVLGSKNNMTNAMSTIYPQAPLLFKDRVSLDMLGLPLNYKESKLRKSIVSHMKDFILEMGKDFLFIDEEHRINIGGKTFKIDLLFYHRLLQCMVAIELKTTEFHPKDLGQLEFYLEALDQEERRSNENPSIGILLCKEANMDVVRVALNRSMSPTMVTQYKEQLQVGGVIQRSLVEFCKFINEMNEK